MLHSLKHMIVARLERAIRQHNRIGPDVRGADDCWISGSVLQGQIQLEQGCRLYSAHLEGNVSVGRYSSLWGPDVHVMGRIQGISIGAFCSIARHVSLQEDNHATSRATTWFVESNLLNDPDPLAGMPTKGRIEIGNDVWIGAGAQVLSGVSVGTGAVIVAGAIVARDVEPYSIVAGNPARHIKYRFDAITRDELLASEWWTWSVERIREDRDFLLRNRSM